MKLKIDLKDKKIFYLLTENSRLRPQKIALKVGLSKNAVIYRIRRLVKEGYIKKFLPITNFQKFGVYSYDLFIKIRVNAEEERKIKNYFKEHPNVIWATTLFGKWDLFAQIAAKDVNDFSKIFEEITIFLGHNLENYEVKHSIKRIKIDRRVFDYEKETNYKFKPSDTGENIVKLDGLDKKILWYLNTKDGLASYRKVGKAIGASSETTRNRMLSLLRNGVIVRYTPEIVYAKLGFETYLVIINFHYITKETIKEIYAYINHNKEIKIAFETVGKQEIYFYAVVNSPKDLEDMIKDMRNEFYETILSIDHMLITEELKLDFFPVALEKI